MTLSFKNVWQAIERHDLDHALATLDTIDCRTSIDKRNQLALSALILSQQKKYDAALTSIQSIIAMGEQIANDYNLMGNIYLKMQQWDQAIAAYQTAIELDPDYANAHHNLAHAYRLINQPEKALAIYQLRNDHDPTEVIPAYQLSVEALKRKDYTKALAIIEPAFQAHKLDPKLMTQYAQCAFLNHDYQTIINTFSATDLSAMTLLDTQWYLAQAYFETKNYAKANHQAEAIMAKDPAYDQIHCLLGHIALAHKDYDAALKYYLREAERAPTADIYFNIAIIMAAKQRQKEAMTYYQEALKLEPNYAACYQNMGLIYLSQGSKQDALDAYGQALALDPDNAEVNYIWHALSDHADQPTHPPESFVSHLFDQYAPYYDTHLIETLRYQVPERCVDLLLDQHILNAQQAIAICDLGCGTGLTGKLLKPYAETLTGIDISESMLQLAEKKHIYDTLLLGDMLQVMQSLPRYDLMIAADVLPYIGDLTAFFESLSKHLNAQGTICLSFECIDQQKEHLGFHLQQTARYAHAIDYIEKKANDYGLAMKAKQEIVLRKDHKQDIVGCILLLGT